LTKEDDLYCCRISELFTKYENLFDTHELKKILNCHPFLLKYVKNRTLDLCKYTINVINKKKYYKEINDLLICINEYDEELVDMIIMSPNVQILEFCHLIPNKYLNKEKIHKIIMKDNSAINKFTNYVDEELCNKMFESSADSIRYIPTQFHNQKMIDTIIKNKKYHLYKYIDIDPNVYTNIFEQDPNNIKFIPGKFQTYEMCASSVMINIDNLQYCHCITHKLLNYIFESKKSTETKDRFRFINYFEEDSIIRILKVRPELLEIIYNHNKTRNIILAAIMTNGNALSYVNNPTPEYEKIASIYRPKPRKTIFCNSNNKKKFTFDILFIFR